MEIDERWPMRISPYTQPDFIQTFDQVFNDIFEFYVAFDQHSATSWEIGLKFQQIFNRQSKLFAIRTEVLMDSGMSRKPNS
jgi:hypothetical protein